MSIMRKRAQSRPSFIHMVACALVACACQALAQEQKPAEPAAQTKPAEHPADAMPPLPADAHVDQTIQLNGKPLKYTATVGTLPVYGQDGKKTADVVYTAYTAQAAIGR